MRAFVLSKYKEQLQLDEVAEPTVGEGDVLVRVDAASLNQLDVKIAQGEFKQILPYALPLILGNDFAGTVIRVGPKVRGFKPGDEVYARPSQDRQKRVVAAMRASASSTSCGVASPSSQAREQ